MNNCNFFDGTAKIEVGQKVYVHNFTPSWGEHSKVRTVTKIDNDKIYVDGMQTHFKMETGRQVFLDRTHGNSFLFTSPDAFKYFQDNGLLNPLLKNRYNANYHNKNDAFIFMNGREVELTNIDYTK